ncbi:MAG: hypothetical protein AAF483_20785 [Planctomycetota bacterium]
MNRRKRNQNRSGVAVVEFAAVVPVLTIIFLVGMASIHKASLTHDLQSLAHIGAVYMSDPGANPTDIKNHLGTYSQEIGIDSVNVSIELHSAEIYKVTVQAPSDANSAGLSFGGENFLSASSYVYRPDN